MQVADDLRHKNLDSVMCYFRPTEEDIFDANTFASETMISFIKDEEEFDEF